MFSVPSCEIDGSRELSNSFRNKKFEDKESFAKKTGDKISVQRPSEKESLQKKLERSMNKEATNTARSTRGPFSKDPIAFSSRPTALILNQYNRQKKTPSKNQNEKKKFTVEKKRCQLARRG